MTDLFIFTGMEANVRADNGLGSLDLSHLTEEEQETILQVLLRDLDLRRQDEGRVRSEVNRTFNSSQQPQSNVVIKVCCCCCCLSSSVVHLKMVALNHKG